MSDVVKEEVYVPGNAKELLGTQVGFVIAKRVGNDVYLGYALVNPTDDWDADIGETIAWRRLLSRRYCIRASPSSREVDDFISGRGRQGRNGKFHPLRECLIKPSISAIARASNSRTSVKLPSSFQRGDPHGPA